MRILRKISWKEASKSIEQRRPHQKNAIGGPSENTALQRGPLEEVQVVGRALPGADAVVADTCKNDGAVKPRIARTRYAASNAYPLPATPWQSPGPLVRETVSHSLGPAQARPGRTRRRRRGAPRPSRTRRPARHGKNAQVSNARRAATKGQLPSRVSRPAANLSHAAPGRHPVFSKRYKIPA